MYTQCPECDTIFRVNAAVLRAAQGQVRCGVCDATFDAIRFLTDEIEAGVNAASASRIHYEPFTDAPSSTSTATQAPPEHASATAPFRPSPALPLVAFDVAEASNEWWATPISEWPDPLTEEATDAPAVSAQDAHDPLPELASIETRASQSKAPAETDCTEPLAELALIAPGERMAAFDLATTPSIELEDVDRSGRPGRPGAARGRERGGRPQGWLVCAVLLLALLAQVVDHERERLVSLPTLAPTLTAVYAALGRPLEPHWNIAAYDIREWTATPDAESKTIRLRARIRNRAQQSQPWPLLRLVFEDRYGGLVARRDFTPAEYLPGHPAAAGAIAAGGLIEADLALVDPGNLVVSYEIDTCLPQGSDVGCGADYKGMHPE